MKLVYLIRFITLCTYIYVHLFISDLLPFFLVQHLLPSEVMIYVGSGILNPKEYEG